MANYAGFHLTTEWRTLIATSQAFTHLHLARLGISRAEEADYRGVGNPKLQDSSHPSQPTTLEAVPKRKNCIGRGRSVSETCIPLVRSFTELEESHPTKAFEVCGEMGWQAGVKAEYSTVLYRKDAAF